MARWSLGRTGRISISIRVRCRAAPHAGLASRRDGGTTRAGQASGPAGGPAHSSGDLLDDDVRAGAAVQRVLARSAVEHVIAGPAADGVVAGTSDEEVRAVASVD